MMRLFVPIRVALVLVSCGSVLGLSPRALFANGWEHAAIPFEALIWGLGEDAAETRMRSAQSMGQRGQAMAVPFLLDALKQGESVHYVRRAIYEALGRIGEDQALPFLNRCLDEEDREEVRGTCAIALGRVGAEESLDRLLRAFERDDKEVFRRSVVEALRSYRQDAAVDFLFRLIDREDRHVYWTSAVESVSYSGSPKAVAALLKALSNVGEDSDRAQIVSALGRLRDRSALDALTRLLPDADNPFLRTAIAVAMGQIRHGGSLPALVGLLDDREPEVQLSAVRSLRELSDPESLGPLLRIYRDLDEAVKGPTGVKKGDLTRRIHNIDLQREILYSLLQLDPAAGLEPFLEAAKPQSVSRQSQADLQLARAFRQRRGTALYALGYTGKKEAESFLAGPFGLGDSDPHSRSLAVRSLAVLGRPNAVAQILPMLEDESAEVRWRAAVALGRLGAAEAVPPLIGRLADKHGQVRREAALSLGYLGDAMALDAVEELARSDSAKKVRQAAAFAAGLLAPKE